MIQMPIEDKYWSGAIFVKDEKIIPVINTALPRANQYFTAWHEIYHLIFDKVSFDHFIETDNTLEERKAEYFAACMLLNGVDRYFTELPEADGQFSKLVNDIPNPDIAISMGCNVGCPFIGRPFDDNWGLEDPTGKSDEEFKIVIEKSEKIF